MDPAATAQPKSTGIPRLSRLPLPKSAIPVPSSNPTPANPSIISKCRPSNVLSPRPPPNVIPKPRASLGLVKPTATVRSKPPSPASQHVFIKPLPPKQSSRPSGRATQPIRSAFISKDSSNQEDELGNLNGFRTASRASSRAGHRPDENLYTNGDKDPTTPTSRKGSRPSLSDRTIESLAMLTPTPRGKRRSSFFNPESPMAPPSRPASALSGRPPISNISTPKLRAAKSIATLGSSSTARLGMVSRGGQNHNLSRISQSPATPALPGSAVKISSRGLVAGTPSVSMGVGNTTNGTSILKKPQQSRLSNGPSRPGAPPVRRALPARPKPVVPFPTEDTSTDETPAPSAAKSSAALREHIRQAKAARRPVTSNQPGTVSNAIGDDGDGFEREELHADPFNQQPKNLVMRKRIDAARTEGRLNISALGLKSIPDEVLSMYDFEANKDSRVAWNEVVDLTKFIAADNEIESIPDSVFPDIDVNELGQDDETPGPQFGGIEVLDLHGNVLFDLPIGLRRLQCLSVVNLSRNGLTNSAFEIITQVSSLRDLNMSENSLDDELPTSITNLHNLEHLNLQGNKLTALPDSLGQLSNLKVLNVSDNLLFDFSVEALSGSQLVKCYAAKNKLSGRLFDGASVLFPSLQILDISINQLTSICEDSTSFNAPYLQTLNLSSNRLTALPNLTSTPALETIYAADNSISTLPQGFLDLQKIRTVDLTGNSLRSLDDRLALMESLESLIVAANPLAQRKFLTMSTGDVKAALAVRLGVE